MTDEELLRVIEEAKASGATRLDLSNKGLTSLPSELFQLTSLTELNLRGNNLINLPAQICQLISLTKLVIRFNKLSSLPIEISQLKSLVWLNLSGNNLTILPSEIFQLPKLKVLYLDGNPLTSPPIEIAEQGIKVTRQYLASLQQEERPLNQVKLLLIGEGAAGKTSLVKQLLNEDFDPDEDTTHGINIRNWKVEENGDTPMRVNIWDFGGQEIMRATHQFFLSRRSLYVLVLDGRRDERPEYWLRHIESFGGDSPVLVVLNKQDSNP
ncbi:MAG: GTP-binding protein, partial [Candidatus Electrothrix sp. AUS1_2]|nr:GTP-binding protein [Candidatus Electrothrix sp. AUS1_2]